MPRPRSALEAFAAAPPARGYASQLVWSYTKDDERERSTSFERYAEVLGAVVGQLVAAGMRVAKPTSSMSSHRNHQRALRAFFKFLEERSWDPNRTVDNIDVSLILAFGESTASRNCFNCIKLIVAEALRPGGTTLNFPYAAFRYKQAANGKEDLGERNIGTIIAAARRDVVRIWNEFQQFRSDDATEEMKEVAAVAKRGGGILPHFRDDKDFLALAARRRYSQDERAMTTWGPWLYATPESLLPFIILILYALAGNVVSVLEAKRDSMELREDSFRGRRAVVSFVKRRSRRVLSHSFKDAGRFSAPVLIRQVLAMTEPLVEHVARPYKDRMFLAFFKSYGRGDGKHRVRPIRVQMSGYWTTAFCRRHDLRDERGLPLTFRLDMLRPTRINVVQRKSNNIFLTQKVANHKSVLTTFAYVKRWRTIESEREMLADIQTEFRDRSLDVVDIVDASSADPEARGRSIDRDCVDPYSRPGQTRGAKCPEWNYSLTDPHLVIPPEPQFVAALIRDQAAYRDARRFVDEVRFARLYADRLRILDDLVNQFADDSNLLRAAEHILSTMSPAPEIR